MQVLVILNNIYNQIFIIFMFCYKYSVIFHLQFGSGLGIFNIKLKELL